MTNNLLIYNTLTQRKEIIKPLNPPFVGMYVCGPTVYSDPHLGHARAAIVFDVIFRYLKHLGYKVRYVRNITDVGHLENVETGEDKILKKAKIEQLEPMEVVQYYTNRYHENLAELNTLPPSIEPHATGHIIEQIELVKQIFSNGFAYEVQGSVYFDVAKYNEKYNDYGKLSGRNLDDLIANTRALEGQEEKRNPFDFALWKKAQLEHIMRWPSPWGVGFPGWHTECTAMSIKYLGEEFDIHGGGIDLIFPHHECEIAQSVSALNKDSVKYWIHNNLVTINGQKMSKSLNNFITLNEIFRSGHPSLSKTYSPMTVRFLILQAHYRSTIDFSDSALQAAEKGLDRLMSNINILQNLNPSVYSDHSQNDIKNFEQKCYTTLNDDFNTPQLIAHLFDGIKIINSIKNGSITISSEEYLLLKKIYQVFVFDILGLKEIKKTDEDNKLLNGVMELVLRLRNEARQKKDWATSDKIRDELKKLNITINDFKDYSDWNHEG